MSESKFLGIVDQNVEAQIRGLWRQGCTPEQICVYAGENYEDVVLIIENYFQIKIDKTNGGKLFSPAKLSRRYKRNN